MIKRFCFGTSALPSAPASIRPSRVTRNIPVDELASQYACTVQWFTDADALARYESWEGKSAATAKVVAEEVIQRGGDWLEQRWTDAGRKWKHVSLARRAAGLSQDEFSHQWRAHAGRATTRTAGSASIPEAARGLAYVQNHPLPGVQWTFDAITEVWFDNQQSMQSRIEWFRDNVTTDALFGETTFFAVMEELLEP